MDFYELILAGKLNGGGGGGGGQWTTDGLAQGLDPNGSIVISDSVTAIDSQAFRHDIYLTEVRGNGITTLGSEVFRDSTGLIKVFFPNMTANIPVYTFGSCSALTVADLGKTGQINNNSFNGAGAMRTLILRKDGVSALQSWASGTLGGIYSHPAESTIYVPENQISSYQGASNWVSAYNAGVTFAKIEGSIYE